MPGIIIKNILQVIEGGCGKSVQNSERERGTLHDHLNVYSGGVGGHSDNE